MLTGASLAHRALESSTSQPPVATRMQCTAQEDPRAAMPASNRGGAQTSWLVSYITLASIFSAFLRAVERPLEQPAQSLATYGCRLDHSNRARPAKAPVQHLHSSQTPDAVAAEGCGRASSASVLCQLSTVPRPDSRTPSAIEDRP